MSRELLPFERVDLRRGACDPKPAWVWIESWAGRLAYACDVIGETPQRYRVRMAGRVRLRRRYINPGDEILVPKRAVEFRRPNA